MQNNKSFSEIPIIDFTIWREGTDQERQKFANEVGKICHEVGFFVAVNHGIEARVIESIFTTMQQIFALPAGVKHQIVKSQSRHFRGWEQVGTEVTNNRTDYREQIDFWNESPARSPNVKPAYLRMLGPNQWLDDMYAPGHRKVIENWMALLKQVGNDILRVLSLGLGLQENHLLTMFGNEPMSLTKLIHYPPTPNGGAGVNAHKDGGFITILAAGDTPGLEIQNPEGEWLPVPIVPEGFVVNLGEMLQAVTGNYFVATPHRVITTSERFTTALFLGPSLETPLSPLSLEARYSEAVAASPRHSSAGYMAQTAETKAGVADMSSEHHPDLFGEQIWNYLLRSYPRIAKEHYPDLAVELP